MLAAMGWGQGVRTVVVTATRGDGGQNEIGPELFDALACCAPRNCSPCTSSTAPSSTSRAPSTSATRSAWTRRFEKWGRQEILGDYVRMIRTIRPDIIIAMRPDGAGGGQHHQASAVISREAFLAAGDPAKFPEQIREGLRPWQPKKFYYTGRFGFAGEPPPPLGREADRGGHGRVRPAPGRDVRRDRQPRAQQPQDAGHGAAAVAAGPLERVDTSSSRAPFPGRRKRPTRRSSTASTRACQASRGTCRARCPRR